MRTNTLARVGAVAFVAIALTATAIQMREPPIRTSGAVEAPKAVTPLDPMFAELTRCQGLGPAGASDASCLAAWADNRRRFFGLKPVERSGSGGATATGAE